MYRVFCQMIKLLTNPKENAVLFSSIHRIFDR